MAARTAAFHLLDSLVELGIEHIFGNLGTDHVTLIEELARLSAEGQPAPRVILCPHENTAVHMAFGYAAATGRGQAVLVHVDAGTANAAMGAHNLARTRLPALLMAGRSPHTLRGELPGSRDNAVHWLQDPFDIAGLVRPYVKWEYNLPTGAVTRDVLARAAEVMGSDPPGPVFLTLPRETLAEACEARGVPPARYAPVAAGGIAPDLAERIAAELMAAENPVAITTYLGRRPEAVAVLERLATACGVRVAETAPSFLNIPRDSLCFAGFDGATLAAGADLGLLLDVDVPWVPKFAPRAAAPRWIQLDVDPVKRDFPMWGFPTDLRAAADCATALAQVLTAVEARADAAFHARVAARVSGWETANAARRARLAAAADERGGVDAIPPDHVCAALARHLRPDDIVVNEAVRAIPSVLNHIPRTRPGTYFMSAGGGLGAGGGMALGLRLAHPDRRVVLVCGDGAFGFGNPDSVYAVAQQYGLPILTVVLDNRGWKAVKEAVLRVHPDGAAAGSDEFQARLDGRQQGAVRRFEEVGRAFGAHAERVTDPGDLDAAIARCLDAVERGRAAVLTVRTTAL